MYLRSCVAASVLQSAANGIAVMLFLVVAAHGSELDIGKRQHSVSAGLVAMDFDYREFTAGAKLNHEYGTLPGGKLEWQTRGARYLAEAAVFHARGDVTYGGATQRGAAVRSVTAESIWSGDFSAGWRLVRSPALEYQVLATTGYRDWQRDIRSTAGASGLQEAYAFWYAGIGLRTLFRPAANHTLVLQLTAHRPINPRVKVRFSNALDDARLTLGEQTAMSYALSWQYQFHARLGLKAELFHRAWDLGRSSEASLTQGGAPVATLFEPDSETRLNGLALHLFRRF